MKIAVSVLNSFSYRRASDDIAQFYKEGSVFYIDLEDAEQKAELLLLLSNNFPHRNKISIEFSPALLQVLSLSEIQSLDEFPSNPAERNVIFWHNGLKRLYLYSGTQWIDLSTFREGSNEAIQVSPALFGEIITNGLTNETTIAPAVITNDHISPDAEIELSKLAVNPLDRNNQIGTQSYTTISDFKDGVEIVRLDELQVPASPLSLGNQRISDLEKGINPKDAVNVSQMEENLDDLSISDLSSPETNVSFANYGISYLADPSMEQDAVNLRTLEKRITGISYKDPVRVVDTSTMPYPRAGATTIDGITVVPGQRVLRASDNTQTKNGIWEVQLGTWTRAEDAMEGAQLKAGLLVTVQEGTLNKDSQWMLVNPDGPVVLETSSLVFERKDGIEALNYDGTLANNAGSLGVKHNSQHIIEGLAGLEIASTYNGGEGIDTVGTIETGEWQGTLIGIPFGGTGATTTEQARANLGAADLVAGTSLGIERLPNLSQPITLAQGGTGFAAGSPKEILDFVGGLGGAKNAGGSGTSLIEEISSPTASESKELSLKTLVEGPGIALQDNGDTVVISGQVLPGQSVENAGLGDIELVDIGTNGKLVKELNAGAGITLVDDVAQGVVIGVDKSSLGIDINTDVVGGALSLANGGTGVNAASKEALLSDLGGISDVYASGVGDVELVGSLSGGTGGAPIEVFVKDITAGTGIQVSSDADTVTIGVDVADLNPDINTDLVGYPLSTANGGLGLDYVDINEFLEDYNVLTGLIPSTGSGTLPTGQFSVVDGSDAGIQNGYVGLVKNLEAGEGVAIEDNTDRLTVSSTVKMFASEILETTDTSAPYTIQVDHNLFTDPNASYSAVIVQVVGGVDRIPRVVDGAYVYNQNSTTISFSYNPGPVRINVMAYDAESMLF